MTGQAVETQPSPMNAKRKPPVVALLVIGALLIAVIGLAITSSGARKWWAKRQSTTALEQTVRESPGSSSPWPYYELGIRYARQHRLEDAVHLFEQARSADPDSSDVRLALGKAYIFSSDYPSAVTELKKATELDPDNAEAFRYLSMASRLTHDRPAALEAAKRATSLAPKNPEGWYQYGSLFDVAQNNENDGRPFLKKAVDLRPTDGVYALTYGRSLADGAQFGDAIPYLRTAAKMLPNDVNAHFFLGLCLHRGGKSDSDAAESERELTTAVQLAPNDFKAHFELGNVLEEESKYAPALTEFETAAKLNPDMGEIWFHLSRMADRTGQTAIATSARARFTEIRKLHTEFTSLAHMLQANPNDIPTAIRLGQVLELQGRPKDAAMQYMNILKREPDNPMATSLLEQLRVRMNWPKLPTTSPDGANE